LLVLGRRAVFLLSVGFFFFAVCLLAELVLVWETFVRLGLFAETLLLLLFELLEPAVGFFELLAEDALFALFEGFFEVVAIF
jgi:hypothetical protein